ncbi:hypothetical protein BU17DRAFT_73045 [Hysterangium stoloniferum]|nr:hypothetical protein BU17DRAFT_73045 [Hysterangium stoloniferum]
MSTQANLLINLDVLEYKDIYEMEKNLPQHDLELPFPEGKTGRYVVFSNQIYQLGWNNVLNELLLCTHLAWRTKRAYVFQNYMWKKDFFPWSVPSAPYTPLNALIAGPTAGGPWSSTDNSPRSISLIWWDKVCPEEDIGYIDAATAKNPVRGKDAKAVMDYWVKLFNDMPQRCIYVRPGSGDDFPQTFDVKTVSTPLILPLLEEFRNSPVSRLLHTPPLVNSAIRRNEHILFPQNTVSHFTRYAGMMAIHVRRGDYVDACQHLADWNNTFYMWNLLPDLPDPFNPGGPVEGHDEVGKNTPENYVLFKKRCYPSEEALITKITESKRDWESGEGRGAAPLTTLYILTNANKQWMDAFRTRMIDEGWNNVATTSDLTLDSEQTAVSMAIDMDIARRAAVLIGNGWSSMTSNIVHRRLVDGHPYSSVRFW